MTAGARPTLDPPLRAAGRGEWKTVADITAEAFASDPMMSWVFGSPRAIQSALRVLCRSIYSPKGWCHLHEAGGATMWMPAGVKGELGVISQIQLAIGAVRFASKGAMGRALKLGEVMEAHHPQAPNHYLFTIGTRSDARGKGVGGALLKPVLAQADASDTPVYLENSNPVNTGFYRSHGFEPMGVFHADETAPPMEPMWREPQ